MKIAIVGSRDYPNLDEVRDYVKSLPSDSVIVSGGAQGVDKVAEVTAREIGLEVIIFPAEWNKYGRGAGMKRNADIINSADRVVAFQFNKSRGTQNSIDRAKTAKKELIVFSK